MNITEANAAQWLLNYLVSGRPEDRQRGLDAAELLADRSQAKLLAGMGPSAVHVKFPTALEHAPTDPGLPLSALFDNEPTAAPGVDDCTCCGQPIDRSREHITIVRQLERVDPDQIITVASSRPVAQYHERCAPSEDR